MISSSLHTVVNLVSFFLHIFIITPIMLGLISAGSAKADVKRDGN